jgi:site-specific DNA recombinase
MSTDWRAEQARCLREIERHQAANRSYMEEGVQLLELAQNAQCLFEKQEPREKRRLLNCMVSNCTWRGGELAITFRQPFDLLAETALAHAKGKTAGDVADGFSQIWLPGPDSNQRPSG